VEHVRLEESVAGTADWRKWGPYLSERQWGTVREDYSANGDAWSYFSHDQARSRAYAWGEDGIAGISDDKQGLCFGLGLWNGKDPILKERLFGLTNTEGNHGEDVKEYYFYLDSTPTHSYMKYLYKYPQAAYPYNDLVETNRTRGRELPEYELLDTGIFDADRYFDVFVEYAKPGVEELLARVTVCNRGPEDAEIHLLPQVWFRNTWQRWDGTLLDEEAEKPGLRAEGDGVVCRHPKLGEYGVWMDEPGELLFTENETNTERIFGRPNATPYVKDAFHRYVLEGEKAAVNPVRTGTKAAFYVKKMVPAQGSVVVHLRLVKLGDGVAGGMGGDVREVFARRLQEADEFYATLMPSPLSEDDRLVVRQAMAGMLWSKQYYYFDLERWLDEHGVTDGGASTGARNAQWSHMINDDVISMPDKWEYPWYAAWDLGFHCMALSMVDTDFSKSQLLLMLHEMYMHPNGQVPAYEWNFGDVNPPVHAAAVQFVYNADKQRTGKGDVRFLKSAFQKLLMNFTWWVNRKDRDGRNVFEGGFLGLDNIGVFDRSAPLPTGGYIEQADGTAWMAFYCQQMLQIALELAPDDPVYEDMAQKFVEHFFRIAGAMDRVGINPDELWDEEDGFFYDLLRLPDGGASRLKIRSVVGLLPLCATTAIAGDLLNRLPNLLDKVKRFIERQPELLANIHPPGQVGEKGRHLLAILPERKLRSILTRMLDEERFLGPHGVRSLSRWHLEHPFTMSVHGEEYSVQYMPGESSNGMFGGNSNWRGPVWMPINVLVVRSLLVFYEFYGDGLKVECPTGSGKEMNLYEVAEELTRRLATTFTRDAAGRRAVYGDSRKFQEDPHWRDYVLFYEYFHGDTGVGVGASHQTGWTGAVARLMQLFGEVDAECALLGVLPARRVEV
jgi:hypothetical protein